MWSGTDWHGGSWGGRWSGLRWFSRSCLTCRATNSSSPIKPWPNWVLVRHSCRLSWLCWFNRSCLTGRTTPNSSSPIITRSRWVGTRNTRRFSRRDRFDRNWSWGRLYWFDRLNWGRSWRRLNRMGVRVVRNSTDRNRIHPTWVGIRSRCRCWVWSWAWHWFSFTRSSFRRARSRAWNWSGCRGRSRRWTRRGRDCF